MRDTYSVLIMRKIIFILISFLSISFIACSSNGEEKEEGYEESVMDATLEQKFLDTSWKLVKRIVVRNGQKVDYKDEYLNSIITFSNIEYGTYKGGTITANTIYLNGEKAGWWYINKGQMILQWYTGDAHNEGYLSATFCLTNYNNYLIEHTFSSITYSDEKGNVWYYKACDTPSIDVPGNNTSGTSYEMPDIDYYDYTAYQTKMKVVYKIHNQDKAKVSSAKIYYGTNSNTIKSVTATVSGIYITATISGLTKDTKYYVKCSATGKGGTTTTSTTRLGTIY